ncbi:MAG TPA: ABC transporter ATP-binding protein [Thermomicrobiales bacterium]|nr:ABC transporter ATP-binding protein [Thermomicrobiales bacterium]
METSSITTTPGHTASKPTVPPAAGTKIRSTYTAAASASSASDLVIETSALTKRYGALTAVDNLELAVRRGEVYGFLGPNGAGKTTTLRMLLGLIAPTSGTVRVLCTPAGTSSSLAQVGAMIETPAFYPFLSGEDNLRILARYSGVSEKAIGPVLEQVDLLGRGGDAFKTYSLGMKQRLGVAAALLKDPALLILDEPTNGLDPAGMAEMRTLIRDLGQGNRTVLLSSHLMSEIEQISDRVGIIFRGRIVAEGTVDQLRGADALYLRVDAPGKAKEMLVKLAGVEHVHQDGDSLRIDSIDSLGLDPAYVNQRLVFGGIAVRELRLEQASLESAFLALTNPDQEAPHV